jgi:hypothetical protein
MKVKLHNGMVRLVSGFIIGIFCISTAPTFGQKTITVKQEGIRFATVDRAGDLYTVTSGGIFKYDSAGRLLASQTSIVHDSFDTGNGSRLVAYDGSRQTLYFMNPSLEVLDSLPLNNSIAISPVLACSQGDFGVVVLDVADSTIKFVDSRTGVINGEYRLSELPANISYMRSYQNFLFLESNSNCIEVYNLMGKKLKTIQTPALSGFNFLGEELYYVSDAKVHFMDLFTLETWTSEFDAAQVSHLLLTDRRMFIINKSGFTIIDNTLAR